MADLVTKADLQSAIGQVDAKLDNAISHFDAKLDNLSLRLAVRLGVMLAAAVALLASVLKLA